MNKEKRFWSKVFKPDNGLVEEGREGNQKEICHRGHPKASGKDCVICRIDFEQAMKDLYGVTIVEGKE